MARPAYLPNWIAGICLYLLVASGVVTVVRSIPASYGSIPDDDASSKLALAPSGSAEARADAPQADVAVARNTANRRNRVRCLKCGVIESMRQIVGQDTANVKPVEGDSSGVSGGAVAASAVAGKPPRVLHVLQSYHPCSDITGRRNWYGTGRKPCAVRKGQRFGQTTECSSGLGRLADKPNWSTT